MSGIKELPKNDLRHILRQKKSNENSLKSVEIPRIRNLSLDKAKEAIQISLGIIKKPRKVLKVEKNESNSKTSQEAQKIEDAEKNISKLPEEKVCHKDFFSLPLTTHENRKEPLSSSSSRLQQRLDKLRLEEPTGDIFQLSPPTNTQKKTQTLNPEVEEFVPSSSESSSSSSHYIHHRKGYSGKGNSNEGIKQISLSKLTKDQQLGLLSVSNLPPKYFQDNLDYFIEYNDIIGKVLDIEAVCDYLNACKISFCLPGQSK